VDAQPAELGETEQRLQRLARDAARDQGLQLVRRGRRLQQQRGLLLREDAARGAQPADDVVAVAAGVHASAHRAMLAGRPPPTAHGAG
jgi:hypothetical protein